MILNDLALKLKRQPVAISGAGALVLTDANPLRFGGLCPRWSVPISA